MQDRETLDSFGVSTLENRIRELNDKATQILTALSFAIAAAVLLKDSPTLTPGEHIALRWSLRFWVLGLFPVLAMIPAVKEFQDGNSSWYRTIRNTKATFLWIAVALISCGAIAFLCAVW